ncbi:MAG: hypothetical protein Harvfovirus17_4 [Harvfovirus sp.]|uniref:C2H2-type domain-containing protein n=1 Tax=Harvfovirus sp. TaxID=2487768 RepID=A0A3G5A1V6_9VIRU|nr:MAG: hypothetical protein Harvfovirus17_4 [Harvfovirus sp.]
MSHKLVGFCISTQTQHPVYDKLCLRCQKPPPDNEMILSMDSLKSLEKTPEEILTMKPDEKEIIRSKLLDRKTRLTRCPCPQQAPSDDSIPPKDISISYGNSLKSKNECHCGALDVQTIVKDHKIDSWSCPFCYKIICSEICYSKHLRYVHRSNSTLVVPQLILGGEWCPICRKIIRNGSVNIPEKEWRGWLTNEEICERINKKILFIDSNREYFIKNLVCIGCVPADDEETPVEEKIDIWDLLDLASFTINKFNKFPVKKTYLDIRVGMLLNVLKSENCPEINDLYLKDGRMARYVCDLWAYTLYKPRIPYTGRESSGCQPNVPPRLYQRLLKTPKEVRLGPVLAENLLHQLRKEICLFQSYLVEIGLPIVLCEIVREYMPWQLWNFEKVLGQLHYDVKKYGPSLAALLFIIR